MLKPDEWEADHGFDETGHQRMEAILSIGVCPKCGEDVHLIAETESWTYDEKSGRWLHEDYGPGQSVCCNTLLVDSWDGCAAFALGEGGASD